MIIIKESQKYPWKNLGSQNLLIRTYFVYIYIPLFIPYIHSTYQFFFICLLDNFHIFGLILYHRQINKFRLSNKNINLQTFNNWLQTSLLNRSKSRLFTCIIYNIFFYKAKIPIRVNTMLFHFYLSIHLCIMLSFCWIKINKSVRFPQAPMNLSEKQVKTQHYAKSYKMLIQNKLSTKSIFKT